MHLTHLSLTNFRNFARLDVDVPCGSVLLVGANAQGKTSVLEAIYFLATLTSFHATHDRQLINFLSTREKLAVARIVASYQRERSEHRLEVRLIQDTNGVNGASRVRKEIVQDGTKLKMSQAVGQFNAVLFLPQMVRIIDGAPEERRRFLNLAISQVNPRYAETLADYNQSLSQRNALLKQLNEFGGDAEQLLFWDEQLAAHGSQLIEQRIQAIQELERFAALSHHGLTHGNEVLRLVYQPAYDPLPHPEGQYALPLDAPIDRSGLTLERIRLGFRESLLMGRNEDVARGQTTLGPHRDEMRFLQNGVDLGTYGSRGQVRTAMLALKLAEVAWMRGKTGFPPVLLLDEALAELDQIRRADLLSRLADNEQILLTTTDIDLFDPAFVQEATLWEIAGGRLIRGV
jgi:DNA replication and repair protein RecF